MLRIQNIIGEVSDPQFGRKKRDLLVVDRTSASKRRFRGFTASGVDVVLELRRGTYLYEGAVLAESDRAVIVVERALEEVVVVELDRALSGTELVKSAAMVAHAFGNQHVPIEISGREIRVPVTTSAELAAATVSLLGLERLQVSTQTLKLGCARPLLGSASHHSSSD